METNWWSAQTELIAALSQKRRCLNHLELSQSWNNIVWTLNSDGLDYRVSKFCDSPRKKVSENFSSNLKTFVVLKSDWLFFGTNSGCSIAPDLFLGSMAYVKIDRALSGYPVEEALQTFQIFIFVSDSYSIMIRNVLKTYCCSYSKSCGGR